MTASYRNFALGETEYCLGDLHAVLQSTAWCNHLPTSNINGSLVSIVNLFPVRLRDRVSVFGQIQESPTHPCKTDRDGRTHGKEGTQLSHIRQKNIEVCV
jgi:hypothetical protein